MTAEHPASIAAPIAARTSTIRSHHGDAFDDPYEWFRAKEDEQVLAHLSAENAYTESATAHLEGLRSRIFDEIKTRTLETDLSVPSRRGDWWYYGRSHEDKRSFMACTRLCPPARKRVSAWAAAAASARVLGRR